MADLRELAVFCHKMYNALHAGFDIQRSLIVMQDDTKGALGDAIKRTAARVSQGTQLHLAMRSDDAIYTPELVDAVYVTEQTGHIEKAFSLMAMRFDAMVTTKRKIRQAATYPVIVLIVAILAYLAVSAAWHHFGEALFSVIVFFFLVFIFFLVKYSGKELSMKNAIIGNVAIHLPFYGKLIMKSELADFASNMAVFYDCGMPVDKAVQYSCKTIRYEVLRKKLMNAADWVSHGNPLSDALQMQGIFPSELIHSLRTGEASGNVSEMLEHIAGYYRNDIQHSIDMIFTVLRQ